MLPRSHTTVLASCALLLAGAGLARPASAQTGLGGATGTTTTTFTADDFRIVVQQTQGAAFRDFDLQRFFNISNCQCAVPVYLYFTLSTSGFQKRTALPEGSVEFWTGLSCNDTTTSLRTSRCVPLTLQGSDAYSMVLSAFANAGGVVIPTNAQVLSQNFGQSATTTVGGGVDGGVLGGTAGPSGPAACTTGLSFQQTFWALVKFSTSNTQSYDVVTSLTVQIDLAPPPAPANFKTGGGNEAVVASWDSLDTSLTPDLLGYQVLCDRAGTLQVFKSGSFNAGYGSCATAASGASDQLDPDIMALNPDFICSPQLSALATSYRVRILENAVTYGVAVVAIDTHYNPSAPAPLWGVPQQTLSFYDVYRNGDDTNNKPGQQPDPGKAAGGYCAVGDTGSIRAGAGGAAALAMTLALALARRRRPKGRR